MTYEEAIEFYKVFLKINPANLYQEAAKCSINALEKQIPTKPIKKNPVCYANTIDGEKRYSYTYLCPQCGAKVNSEGHHCPCGQSLDWNEPL